MTRVLLLFGGESAEHAVSLTSAAAVLSALDRDRYTVYPVYITERGGWLYLPRLKAAALSDAAEREEGRIALIRRGFPCTLSANRHRDGLFYEIGGMLRHLRPDAILPLTHGGAGEDGRLFGLLSLSGIPYVGGGTAAAAMAMDKAAAKTALSAIGIPTLPFVTASPDEGADMDALLSRVTGTLSFPLFCKPNSGGSSVGAAVAMTEADFPRAFRTAAATGDRVLIEPYFPARELEVAVLAHGGGAPEIAPAAEIRPPAGRFYDYAAKYETAEATLLTVAPISPACDTRVRAYAEKAFRALGIRSLARIDFFLSREDESLLYFNEINLLPGMTAVSMFPRAMTRTRSFSDLLSLLIEGAESP